MTPQKIRDFFKFLKATLSLMAKERLLLILFLVLSVIAALTEGVGISLVVPILESQSNNNVFANVPVLSEFSELFKDMAPIDKLQSVAIVLGIVWATRGILLYFVELLGGVIPFKLQRELYAKGYKGLIEVEFSYFNEKGIGEHLNTLTELTTRVTQLLTSFAIALNAVILLVVYLFLMITLSWKLALAAAVFVTCITGLLKYFTSGPLHHVGEDMSHKNVKLSQTLHETMTGMKFIKTSSAQSTMIPLFHKRLNEKIHSQIRMTAFQALTHPFLVTAAGLFICVLLYSFTFIENEDSTWISGLLMFILILTRLLSPLSQLNAARAQFYAHYFSLAKLTEFYNETRLRAEKSGDKQLQKISKGIEFKNVTFKYPNTNAPVILNLNLTIPKGQMTAIVGPSGSGKSTLVALLTKLMHPNQGHITIDDLDINDISLDSLRRTVSLVSQDIFIFNDTLRNNLCFAIPDPGDRAIEKAIKLAAADEFIDQLPDGLETMMGDRGTRLSGGQQQRIAIARAILRQPDLLILDEATSHLDTFSEQVIQEAVEFMRQDHTILVIAHRLSTIRSADKVVVMKDGHVIEQGSHEELMHKRGTYCQMIESQNLDLVDNDLKTTND